MRKISLILIGCFSFIQLTATTIYRDSIPVNQQDVATIDAIIHSLYDVISGAAGEKRNWDRMRTLFLSEAKLMATRKNTSGLMSKRVMSVEDYIMSSGPILEKDGFFERELFRKTEQYGSVAHVFSTYDSKRKLADDVPFMRGINSIQLWYDGYRWWIVSVFFQSESADNPLPEKYLH